MRKRSILFFLVCCAISSIFCGASGLFTAIQTHDAKSTAPEIAAIQLEHLRIIPSGSITATSNRTVSTVIHNQVLELMPTTTSAEVTLTVSPEQFKALTEAFS